LRPDDFFLEFDFLLELDLVELFFLEDFFELDFFAGTFAPSERASESPIAIACFRLFTFFPLRPLLSLPRLNSCISRSTDSEAFGLYFRLEDFFLTMLASVHTCVLLPSQLRGKNNLSGCCGAALPASRFAS
jgi:hypothetical protein